jgi:hypothetical protein
VALEMKFSSNFMKPAVKYNSIKVTGKDLECFLEIESIF